MPERRPLVIYPEYFDFNLGRSQGRKVPANQSVKKPTIDEVLAVIKPIVNNCDKSSKSHSGNWSSNSGSIVVDYEGSKTSLLHKIGIGLKKLRKTD
ncbi:MAG: signal recognition particle subunit SRP19/SEC65 family protein [SAR86 cluster bacterium]|nr:signal recognition particle subunit SRP19/SEC65 family protein [SAR86 cluster bacterium]